MKGQFQISAVFVQMRDVVLQSFSLHFKRKNVSNVQGTIILLLTSSQSVKKSY